MPRIATEIGATLKGKNLLTEGDEIESKSTQLYYCNMFRIYSFFSQYTLYINNKKKKLPREALLMSAQNICFLYGEIRKKIPGLSPNTPP